MYEQKPSPLPFIQCLWRASAMDENEYDDTAKDTWGLGFTRHADGILAAELLGPAFRHKVLPSTTVGDEYWGVEFYPYVTMQGVDKPSITDKLVPLPVVDGHFSIGSDAYKIPDFANLEVFCQDLADQGIISHLTRHIRQSLRSRQRNYRQAIGLTQRQVEQIKRAERAAELLKNGIAPIKAALEAGYADQAHMTRSLKALLGKTPAQFK